jgi:hypothetical protein
LFSIDLSARPDRADFHAERLADQPLECRRMSRRGPQFQLRVAGGPELEERVLPAVMQLERADGLRMAAVEPLGKTQDGRQCPNRPPLFAP